MVRAQANQATNDELIVDADFSNTDDRKGGRSAHVPPGDYLLEVADARRVAVKSDPTGLKKQIAWIFRIVAGEAGIGQIVYFYTTLDQEQKGGLWQLRNLLSDLAGGIEIPKQKAKIDLGKKVGQRVGATLVDDDPYNKENPDGSVTVIEKSVISLTFPADKYVGAPPAHAAQTQPVAQVAAPAPVAAPAAPVNGAAAQAAANAVEVAAAIAQPTEDDADIPPLPVAEL